MSLKSVTMMNAALPNERSTYLVPPGTQSGESSGTASSGDDEITRSRAQASGTLSRAQRAQARKRRAAFSLTVHRGAASTRARLSGTPAPGALRARTPGLIAPHLDGGATPDLTQYTYDALGNLTRVEDDNEGIIEYTVDGFNRRIARTQHGLLTHQYVWSGALRIVAELDGSGQVVSRFVYGSKVNVPELVVQPQSSGPDKVYRVITDHLGSPVYVVNVADPNDVLLDAEYDEWGNVTSYRANGVINGGWPVPFGFAGGLYDEATGFVRFGARDFDPEVGRWTAKDPILWSGQQPNLYVYVFSDPVNFIDYEGELPTVAIGAGIGALAGAAAAALQGGDTQAIVAGAIGGAVAGGIAGTGVGLLGSVAAQGFGAGLGGLVGDFVNLRPGMDAVGFGEVGRRFAVRAGLGIAGGQFVGGISQLAAPGIAGAASRRLSEFIVGGACNLESESDFAN